MTPLQQQKAKRNQSLLKKAKEESEKADLKLNIQKAMIMASGPITSWQIDRGKNGNSDRLYFLGYKLLQT